MSALSRQRVCLRYIMDVKHPTRFINWYQWIESTAVGDCEASQVVETNNVWWQVKLCDRPLSNYLRKSISAL